MKSSFSSSALLAGVAMSVMAACSPADGASEGSTQDLSQSGDPQAGYAYLANGGYMGSGIPLSLMKLESDLTGAPVIGTLIGPVVDSFFPLVADQVFIDSSDIPGRTGVNATLSHGFNAFTTERGNEVVDFNCLNCHSEKMNGSIIIGLGNTTRDFTGNLGLAGDAIAAAAPLLSEGDRLEANLVSQRLRGVGPYTQMSTVGTNPAIGLTYALFAHRDPQTMAWSDTPLIDPPTTNPLPVDVPAWWQVRKRNTLFASAEMASHRGVMMLASSFGAESSADVDALGKPFTDVEAYLRTLPPPPYPGTVDPDLAVTGQGIFEKACSGCHGTYGATPSYPELVVPVDEVGTDPFLAQSEIEQADRYHQWIEQSPYAQYGSGALPQTVVGYVAVPLDGVWATAPYLHNGSVPTLEAVLDSSQRPRYWTRSFDTADYDVDNPGWPYQELEFGKGIAHPFDGKYVYDTDVDGYSNSGHTFGDSLSPSERAAVIEYLKTL